MAMERVVLWLLLLVSCAGAWAGQWAMVVNGHAMHLRESPLDKNEENYGLGLQYDGEPQNDWIAFAFGSGFEDSREQTSFIAGGGVRKRYPVAPAWDIHADLGMAAMFMTRKSYKEGRPFPAALPVASLGTSRVALNIAYIPDVSPDLVPLVFFQLMYTLE